MVGKLRDLVGYNRMFTNAVTLYCIGYYTWCCNNIRVCRRKSTNNDGYITRWFTDTNNKLVCKFKELCTLLFNGPLADITEERQVNFLLLWVGEEGREIAASWDLSNADRKKLSPYWGRFEKFVKPKSNFRVARFKLRAAR